MANIDKFNAYKKIAKNYFDAANILSNKPLVLGEPAVVPYYSPSEDDEDRVIKLLMGVGSINGAVEIINSSGGDASTRIDDAQIYNSDASTVMTMRDTLDYIFNKIDEVEDEIPTPMEPNEVDDIINGILNDQ